MDCFQDEYEKYEKELRTLADQTGGKSKKLHLMGLITGPAKDKMSPQLNDSTFLAFCGNRRSGKSMAAIAFAHTIQQNLSVKDNVAFSFEELKELIYSKEHTVIIWDEAAVTSYSRDFMSKTNKELNKFFQVFGWRRVCILATFQTLGMLDCELRSQLDAVLWCKSEDRRNAQGTPYSTKYIMPFKVTKSPFFPSQIKPFDWKPPQEPNYENIGWIEIPQLDDFLKSFGVSKSFISDYLKRKEQFFRELGNSDEAENIKFDKRSLKTMEVQKMALQNSVNYMKSKLNMSQQKIADTLEVPKATLHSWKFF